jgi:hypothetical protein
MGVIVRDRRRILRPSGPSPCGWWGLTFADWRLIAVVAIAQIAIAAALRAMPLSGVRARADRFHRLGQYLVRGSDERIAWAINASGRLGRSSTCLVRALVAELVLGANDGPVILTIGVNRTPTGALEAHAWVTRQGRVVMGATSDHYIPLATWSSLTA